MNRKKGDGFASCFRMSVILGTVSKILSFVSALLCGYLVSQMLSAAMAAATSANGGTVYRYALWTAGVMMVGLIPIYIVTQKRSTQMRREEQSFREILYAAVLDGRMAVSSAGELDVKLTEDAGTVLNYYQSAFPNAGGSIVVMAGAGVLLLLEDWRLGLIFLLLNLTQLLPTPVYEKWARRIYENTRANEEDYDNWILEGYNGIRTLKSYCREGWFLEKFQEKSRSIIEAGCRAEKTGTVETVVYSAVDNLLRYGSYIILGLFIVYGGLDGVKAPVLIVLVSYLFSSMEGVFDFRLQHFSCKSAIKRIDIREVAAARKGPESRIGMGATILTARAISRDYDGKTVMRCESVTIQENDKVLLRGINGSGKTTLLRLLLGLEKPTTGEVRSCDFISYALQEEPKLHVTVKEVVGEMERVGQLCGEELRRHWNGFGMENIWEQNLDELSQGECKKFCLACALSKSAKLLVLDEPTNHVDQASVSYLVEVLKQRPEAILICTHDERVDLSWTKKLMAEEGMIREECV